jgi:hypothetical protein
VGGCGVNGVVGFRRTSGSSRSWTADERYDTREAPGSVTVDGLGHPADRPRSARSMKIWFTSNAGAVSFGYDTLTAYARGSRLVGVDDGYVDVASGEPLDPLAPFPDLCCGNA